MICQPAPLTNPSTHPLIRKFVPKVKKITIDFDEQLQLDAPKRAAEDGQQQQQHEEEEEGGAFGFGSHFGVGDESGGVEVKETQRDDAEIASRTLLPIPSSSTSSSSSSSPTSSATSPAPPAVAFPPSAAVTVPKEEVARGVLLPTPEEQPPKKDEGDGCFVM